MQVPPAPPLTAPLRTAPRPLDRPRARPPGEGPPRRPPCLLAGQLARPRDLRALRRWAEVEAAGQRRSATPGGAAVSSRRRYRMMLAFDFTTLCQWPYIQ
eukprot:scaffold210815_cov45-Prasinocladus_malaysianus.AAC.1